MQYLKNLCKTLLPPPVSLQLPSISWGLLQVEIEISLCFHLKRFLQLRTSDTTPFIEAKSVISNDAQKWLDPCLEINTSRIFVVAFMNLL